MTTINELKIAELQDRKELLTSQFNLRVAMIDKQIADLQAIIDAETPQ